MLPPIYVAPAEGRWPSATLHGWCVPVKVAYRSWVLYTNGFRGVSVPQQTEMCMLYITPTISKNVSRDLSTMFSQYTTGNRSPKGCVVLFPFWAPRSKKMNRKSSHLPMVRTPAVV